MNIKSALVAALLATASAAACAASPSAATHASVAAIASPQMPPTDKYSLVATQSDTKGKYQLFFHFVTTQDPRGPTPLIWVKVVRFKSDADKKGYPAEYFLFDVDCASNSYAVTARFEYDADGQDLNPTSHYSKNPIRTKIPGIKSGVYVKPGVSPPVMFAGGLMDQECTEGE